MSWVSSGLKSVRKALHLPPITLGNVATKYAPAAIMAATGNPMGAAATVYGGGAMPQPRPIGTSTFPTFSSSMPNPVQTPGASEGGGGWQDILGSIAGAIGGGAQKVGGYIKDNPLEAAMAGLATMQGVNAAKASARQGKLSDEAINLSKQLWAQGQPLRDKGQAGMLNPSHSNLSDVYTDPFNPFASQKRPLSPPTATITPTRPVLPSSPFPPNRLPTTGPIASAPPLALPFPKPRKLLTRGAT